MPRHGFIVTLFVFEHNQTLTQFNFNLATKSPYELTQQINNDGGIFFVSDDRSLDNAPEQSAGADSRWIPLQWIREIRFKKTTF